MVERSKPQGKYLMPSYARHLLNANSNPGMEQAAGSMAASKQTSTLILTVSLFLASAPLALPLKWEL